MKKIAKPLITVLLAVALLVPTIAMIGTYAAIVDYPVELAFNNIFVFDKWASNKLSTTIVNSSNPVDDKLDISIEDGSFTFTNQYASESYTGHGMSTGSVDSAGNFQYYMMDVEPGTTYAFSYNLTNLTSGLNFTPFVFFFDENGSYLSLTAQSFSGSGDTSFVFTVPTNANYIQVRFTLSGTGSADVKNISISKADKSFGSNIYDFDAWASNANSSKVSPDANYNGGTITNIDTANNSVTLTTNGANATGILFTNFSFGSGNGYYMMDVTPNATYSLSYNVVSCNFDIGSCRPYIAYYNADGNFDSYTYTQATDLGNNEFTFTIPADIEYIQFVYGIEGIHEANKSCTVKDVAIQKTTIITGATSGVPHRKVYTYNADGSTYGELPVPSTVPNGYVFAEWYTGVNGTGELITENTPIAFESFTVYPKYEPIVNSISIKTLPVKTSYTVGERVNPTGLVLEATVGNLTSTIESGYRCTPEYLTATGTQTVTVHYGGKTATYTVQVSASITNSVVVNGSTVGVSVTNNVYTFTDTVSTGEFNKYVITYEADAYFEGIITYSDDTTEQFFLEPSSNFGEGQTPEFTSFIDGYLEKVTDGGIKTTAVNSHTRNGIKSIKFTPLDNKSGEIDLLSFTTSKAQQITNAQDTLQYFENSEYKVGIDILNGGVVSEIFLLNSDVVARVYEHKDADNNITYETLVDYKENLPGGYIEESTEVNLINTYDTGRYLQQSYYGTFEKPYETGYYNRADWNYNPVQGGNVGNEASKVLDYEITDEYIYIKARPLDWAKWSDEHAENCIHKENENDANTTHSEACWGDEYITDTYIEAKYVFEDGMIKTYCRMVDYSGLPSAQTTQELPAFYTIEPLNNFVYNDVSEDDAWQIKNLVYDESPEFWGITQDYKDAHYPNGGFDPNVDVAEHWAAFMAGQSSESFGIGLYTPETTNFFYGVYPQKYAETVSNGVFGQTNTLNYRHAETTDPASEDDSSYIAPIGVRTFESFKPTEYTYTITTGTIDEIRDTFGVVYDETYVEEFDRTHIAVPETIYMNPSAGQSTTAQYFVNNLLDANGNLSAEADNDNTYGAISVYSPGSTAIEFKVTAVNGGIGDPVVGGGTVDVSYENTRWPHSLIKQEYNTGATEDWFDFRLLDLAIDGTGVSEGGTALIEWEITVYYGDNDATGKTYYAYSTLYSPWIEPVGAATRAKTGNSLFDQSVAWVSGVHGYTANSDGSYWVAATDQTLSDEGEYSDKGTLYAKVSGNYPLVPLLNNIGDPGKTTVAVSEFLTSSKPGSGIDSPTIRYFSLSAKTGVNANHGTLVADVSPVANLTVDTSRYTNLNQIPNLTVGYNITDVENNEGVYWYVSDFTEIANTLDTANDGTNGTGARFYNYTKQESAKEIANKALNEWFDGDGTGVIIEGSATSNVAVSSGVEYNQGWNRAVVTNAETYDYVFKGAAHAHKGSDARAYSINFVQLRTDNVNKANLRELVLMASSLDETNYTSASWSAFKTALKNAANELGNPTDSDISAVTTELRNKMDALQTPVTLVANGGSFSGAETKVVNLTVGFDTLVTYNIPEEYNPTRDGYAVEGWSTDANAAEGTNPVTGGLKPTFYAIWTEGSYSVVYDANGGAGYIAGVTVKHSESFELAVSGFSRDGYSMVGWSTNASATAADYLPGQTVSGLSNTNDATVTLYAVWLESKYTVIYDANGGSGSIASKTVSISESFTLPASGFTKDGCTLLGWATNASATVPEYQLGQTVSSLAAAGEITLYAVWEISDINVTFDNLIDFSAWNKTAGNGVVSDVTDTGFTITANEGVSESTSSSPYFTVEPGKNYMIDIDITDINGLGWDVYIFFCDADGNWIDFADGETNRYSATTRWDSIFMAPDNESVVKAQIRVDANKSGGQVNFNNIRVYEYEGTGINVTPVNKTVEYGETFGTLPTPTKKGYTFVGWYDGETLITESSTVTQTSTVHLKSKWVVSDASLVSDTVVVDFASPIAIKPLNNDSIFNSESGTKAIAGVSADGTNPAASLTGAYGTFTVNGTEILYTPTKVVDGVENIYYHASITDDGVTTTVKSQITVAPASNVLYEEDKFTVSNTTGLEWTSNGTAVNANQDSSPVSAEVYGYDSSYKNISQYSNGSALSVTVDETNKRSQNLSFTFEGTGFDLNSACGPDTGVMIISVRDNNANDGKGKMVKSYIIDTYYGDYDEDGISRYGDTLYQVPIVNETELPHSNYTIQVAASYLPSISGALNKNSASTLTLDNGMTLNSASEVDTDILRSALADVGMEDILNAEEVNVVWFDDDSVLNGGNGANESGRVLSGNGAKAVTKLLNVIDSVRVYNPVTDGDAYYISSERSVKYYNVIDNLVSEDGSFTVKDLFAYVTGKDKETITIDNYDSIGPKDELYLTSGTGAVTFTIDGLDKSKSRVMISLRAAAGTPTVEIGTASYVVASNTEMYYDITDYVGDDGTVTIENVTPGTLLSIGSVKLSGIAQASIINVFNLDSALAMINAPATPVELNAPKTEPDADEPETPEEPTDPTEPEEVPTEPTEDTTDPTEPENTTVPTEPENTTVPTEPENTTVPTVPENTTVPTEPENTTVPTEPENTTVPTEPENTTVPTKPENTTVPTEPENTTVPTEPENTTVPTVPENTTIPTESENTTNPDDTSDTTDPENTTDPADPGNTDDSVECWLIRLIKWIIEMFKKIISAMSSFFGF